MLTPQVLNLFAIVLTIGNVAFLARVAELSRPRDRAGPVIRLRGVISAASAADPGSTLNRFHVSLVYQNGDVCSVTSETCEDLTAAQSIIRVSGATRATVLEFADAAGGARPDDYVERQHWVCEAAGWRRVALTGSTGGARYINVERPATSRGLLDSAEIHSKEQPATDESTHA